MITIRQHVIIWTNDGIYASMKNIPPSIFCRNYRLLTHWGRVTHICVGNLTIVGSDNGLSPGRRQAITWTNVGILLIGPLGTIFSEMLIDIHTFSFKKIHLIMSSGKWRPFCLGLSVLMPCLSMCSHKVLSVHTWEWPWFNPIRQINEESKLLRMCNKLQNSMFRSVAKCTKNQLYVFTAQFYKYLSNYIDDRMRCLLFWIFDTMYLVMDSVYLS